MRNRKADIEKYLRGKLSPAEMHALEKEALNDPFLAEALEGVEQAGADNFLYDLHRINRSVHRRSRRRSAKNNSTIRMWGWTSAIAATVLLVAVSGFLVINILKDQAAQKQAMRELASLQAGDSEKDTVLIPLPRETSAYPAEGPQKDEAPLAAGIAAADIAVPQRAVTEKPKETGEAAQQADAADTPTEEVLALNDAPREEASEPEAKEAVARQPENPSTDEGRDKSFAVTDDDKLSRAAKRSESRAAGAEAKAQEPALSAAMKNDAGRIRGTVVSAGDGEALPGVNVMIDGTSTGTVTDAQGNFQLSVPADNTKILFSFIGYESEMVDVRGHDEVNVRLREDMTTLSEVVVTGHASDGGSAEERGTFNFAEPRGGRADFRNYLGNAVKYPAQALSNKTEGRVTVRFTVDTDGSLGDFEVLKGIGHGCEEELIRAIKEGPPWSPSRQAGRPLRDQVKVRFKFELPR